MTEVTAHHRSGYFRGRLQKVHVLESMHSVSPYLTEEDPQSAKMLMCVT